MSERLPESGRETRLAELFVRIAGDDDGALTELVSCEEEPLLRFFRRRCRCDAQARDLVQSTFVALWHYRSNLRETGRASSYLYRVAANEWHRAMRRDRRRQTVQDEAAREADVVELRTAEDELATEERNRKIRELIDALPDAQRDVLLQYRFEGRSCREIAERNGESAKTVESRLRLALEKLTRVLRGREDLR